MIIALKENLLQVSNNLKNTGVFLIVSVQRAHQWSHWLFYWTICVDKKNITEQNNAIGMVKTGITQLASGSHVNHHTAQIVHVSTNTCHAKTHIIQPTSKYSCRPDVSKWRSLFMRPLLWRAICRSWFLCLKEASHFLRWNRMPFVFQYCPRCNIFKDNFLNWSYN